MDKYATVHLQFRTFAGWLWIGADQVSSAESAIGRIEDPLAEAIATPGQTTQTPEALPPVTSSVPAEEQAALPATSLTTFPPPTRFPPNQRLSAVEMAALVTRG